METEALVYTFNHIHLYVGFPSHLRRWSQEDIGILT